MDALIPKFNYILYVVLMMTGLWGMISKDNLIKKIIGMAIFQTSLILFYISTSVKQGATIPIIEKDEYDDHGVAEPGHQTVEAAGDHLIHAVDYMNPLPHVLMLTAIVVGVGTLGMALALAQLVYKQYGTLEEDEIIKRLKASPDDERVG